MRQHPNDCNHSDEEFYGHVELPDGGFGDLYFFYDKGSTAWEYCFRTGELGEYSSSPMSYIIRWNDSAIKDAIIKHFIHYIDNKGL